MTRASTSRDVLDSFRLPLILLDRRRHILHANPAAQRLIGERDLLRTDGGRIACPHAQNNSELCDVIEQVFSVCEAGVRQRKVLPLMRRDGRRVPAVVICIRRGARAESGPGHHALLSVVEPLDSHPELDLIERMFGLTRAQARVAMKIASGATPAACARQLGVKISTVRSHLNVVYRKTGALSQAQLVRVLLSLTIL